MGQLAVGRVMSTITCRIKALMYFSSESQHPATCRINIPCYAMCMPQVARLLHHAMEPAWIRAPARHKQWAPLKVLRMHPTASRRPSFPPFYGLALQLSSAPPSVSGFATEASAPSPGCCDTLPQGRPQLPDFISTENLPASIAS